MMSVLEALGGYGPYIVRARRRYLRLTDEQRGEIAEGFERHCRACEKSEIQPDPMWIAEAVEDMLYGRPGIFE